MNISLQTRLVQSSSVPSAELETARVFLDIEQGDYLSLKGPGLAIWENLASPLSVDELLDRLCERYGIDRERCTRDTMPFLHEMLASGLLRESPEATAP